MTNQNEMIQSISNEVVADLNTGEIIPTEQIVQETNEYRIVRTNEGKYRKDMKYQEYFSRTAETEQEKVELYNVFNDSDNNIVVPLSNMIDKEINIKHVFTQPYESFNEDTGTVTNGVTTTLEDVDGSYYATSSKSVYYTVLNIMQTFGYPTDETYKPVKVRVTGTRRTQGVQINLTLVGTQE